MSKINLIFIISIILKLIVCDTPDGNIDSSKIILINSWDSKYDIENAEGSGILSTRDLLDSAIRKQFSSGASLTNSQ